MTARPKPRGSTCVTRIHQRPGPGPGPGYGPVPSCVSMKSNRSMDARILFKDGCPSVDASSHQQRGTSPARSCVSMKSNRSMEDRILFKDGCPRVEPDGVRWFRPGLRNYLCELAFDTNTVHRKLKLSENNRTVTCGEEDQSYPDHPDRFEAWSQLLCTGLTGRCYWEVKWKGGVEVSVSYRGIRRKGVSDDCWFGYSDQSWSLMCSDEGYVVCHNKTVTHITSSSYFGRVAVYVDYPAGSLSFYRVSSDTLIHLHTFNTTFTQPLYPGFGFSFKSMSGLRLGSSVSLCSLQEGESPPGREPPPPLSI